MLPIRRMNMLYKPYRGHIDIHDWFYTEWFPNHRNLGANRTWLESKVRNSVPWDRTGSKVTVHFVEMETSTKNVQVNVWGLLQRINGRTLLFLCHAHAGRYVEEWPYCNRCNP
jgi:hypothetical protein